MSTEGKVTGAEPLELTYADIEYALLHGSTSGSTILPRFTPHKWWECDVCEVTRAGYFREYEIKMSRSDFKVDAKKEREVFGPEWWDKPASERPIENKHALLAAGDARGPSEFYFVTPKGLLTESDLPAWAGLIEVERRSRFGYPNQSVVRKAPRLHRVKAEEHVRRGMMHSGLWRWHYNNLKAYRRDFDARCQAAKKAQLLRKGGSA